MEELYEALQFYPDLGTFDNNNLYVSNCSDPYLATYLSAPQVYLAAQKKNRFEEYTTYDNILFQRLENVWPAVGKKFEALDLLGKRDFFIRFTLFFNQLSLLPQLVGKKVIRFLNHRRNEFGALLLKEVRTAMLSLKTGLTQEKRIELFSLGFDNIYPDSADDLITFLDGSPLQTAIVWTGGIQTYNEYKGAIEKNISLNGQELTSDVFPFWFRVV